MTLIRSIYFKADPGVSSRHEIAITKRNGVAIAAVSQVWLEVQSSKAPDAGAGLGILYRVIAGHNTGKD